MSTYSKQTKHPVTGEWHEATWIDDFYGRHRYGVQFPDGEMFNDNRISNRFLCCCNNCIIDLLTTINR